MILEQLDTVRAFAGSLNSTITAHKEGINVAFSSGNLAAPVLRAQVGSQLLLCPSISTAPVPLLPFNVHEPLELDEPLHEPLELDEPPPNTIVTLLSVWLDPTPLLSHDALELLPTALTGSEGVTG